MQSRGVEILAAVITTFVVSIAAPVQAGFIGQEITARWLYTSNPNVIETHDILVGPGVELSSNVIQRSSNFNIYIGDNHIIFTFDHKTNWSGQATNGWQFIDKNGTIEEILGFTIGGTTGGVTGLDPEDLVFTGDSVFVNFGKSGPDGDRVLCDEGSTIRLDVVFVPEPATLLLLGTGGLMLRRRRHEVF